MHLPRCVLRCFASFGARPARSRARFARAWRLTVSNGNGPWANLLAWLAGALFIVLVFGGIFAQAVASIVTALK